MASPTVSPITVVVRVPTVLRELTGGQATLDVSLGADATVADALDVVARDHPALVRRVRDEQGALRQHVNVFLGQENIRVLDDLATVVRDGDELAILAAISGG
jgi:molybdopterin converting factor small subunit